MVGEEVIGQKSLVIRNARKQSLVRLFFSLVIIISINVIAAYFFFRLDLTGEKRYSLAPTTKQQLRELKDVIYFKIYLEGDLPAGFKKLRNSVQEMLDEFRVYAKDNIEYEFIDPSANTDTKARNAFYDQLVKKGIQPSNLEERTKGGSSQQVIFPGAIAAYRTEEIPIQLLTTKIGSGTEAIINTSIEGLEYELMKAVRKFSIVMKPKVGFLQGQKELSTRHIADAANAMSEFYQVDTVEIKQQLNALKGFKALIIAKPDTAFDEKDKFIIDQFIMQGGKVLWLVEEMQINMDSISKTGTNIAVPQNLNLADQLFRYGVRVNDDLIMDLQAAPIPIVTGRVGNRPEQTLFPWYFHPLFNPTSNHPIVYNLNAIKGEFVSSLDTVEVAGVKKTILLTSSKYSRNVQSPVRVSLNILRDEPDPAAFSKQHIPVAVLLEGSFRSVFSNRLPQQLLSDTSIHYRDSSSENKMIVISDGDIISNYANDRGRMYPLGYDRYTNQMYGNKNFILNCIDYLCGNENVVALRGKEFRIRLLDKAKTEDTGIAWVALLLPVVLITVYGIIHFYLRRRKYAA
jgi:ABC-2 type transport system permease protein